MLLIELRLNKADQEIRRIAGELKISTSELLLRYRRHLKKTAGNGAKAVTQLELSMNLSRGRLKGFDTLYNETQGTKNVHA